MDDGSGSGASAPLACFRIDGVWQVGRDLVELSEDPDCLDTSGRWAVVQTYEGSLTCARFATWSRSGPEHVAGPFIGPGARTWQTSLDRLGYTGAVEQVKDLIGRGEVYQANVCRVLSAPMPHREQADLGGLFARLATRHPAPQAGFLRFPGLQVASASPELFLSRDAEGWLRTRPIKGTGRVESDLLPKDEAENVMIVDLMRNDLARICEPGSVQVPALLEVERHPGLVHLVSQVRGRLRAGTTWRHILAATTPPGSVSGAPKSSAVRILRRLEPVPRGPYCGVLGWVDADRGVAELAVGIRTFWSGDDAVLRFGTGAGITWGSQADREWEETELKAGRLLALASD